EALAAAFVAALTSVQPRALGDAIWMVARAENEQALLVFQDEEAADEEARSRGGVVIPLPVARDYRPGRKRARGERPPGQA
ncbi:MAG: hypothetical protein ACLQFR_26485, partial [Streptosporangiaceae bacterium]